MNSQIHIHTYNSRITHKLNIGVGVKNLPKKERQSTNKKAKTEQIQQEQKHQYTGDITFLRVQHTVAQYDAV